MILKSLLLYFLFTSVFANECVVVNFESENDYNYLFNNNFCSENMPTLNQWTKNSFVLSDIDSPNDKSTQFLVPSTSPPDLSCASIKPLPLGGGRLEVNIHVVQYNPSRLIVQIFKVNHAEAQHFKDVQLDPLREWETISLNFDNDDNAELTIVLLGATVEDSLIIDSVRFIPYEHSETDEEDLPESCRLYPQELPPLIPSPPAFWSPLSIVSVTILCILILCLGIILAINGMASTSSAPTNNNAYVDSNVYQAPPPHLVPRVKYV